MNADCILIPALPDFKPRTQNSADGTLFGNDYDNACRAISTGQAGASNGLCGSVVNPHGRLWGECYSVTPCAIVVPQDSAVVKPEDLAGVNVHVGYPSGSHYTTIQALEPFLDTDAIKLKFGGIPADRVDQLLEGLAPAATVFGPQLYLVEQLGFRKILDCTFMIAAMVPDGIDSEQASQYYDALRLA